MQLSEHNIFSSCKIYLTAWKNDPGIKCRIIQIKFIKARITKRRIYASTIVHKIYFLNVFCRGFQVKLIEF